ncbi:hypothetical protein D3C81_946050 [compost metagenome]
MFGIQGDAAAFDLGSLQVQRLVAIAFGGNVHCAAAGDFAALLSRGGLIDLGNVKCAAEGNDARAFFVVVGADTTNIDIA